MKQFVCFPWVVVLVALLGGTLTQVGCLNFSYPSFPDNSNQDFIFSNENSRIFQNALQVTPDTIGGIMADQAGRILYKEKFNLWGTKNSTTSFNSTFVLNIKPQTTPGGEGLSFILTGERESPKNSQGEWLGIVNATTNGSSSNIVAIEFDTRQQSYLGDVDDNHVGVNLNSINSIEQLSLTGYGVNISSGEDVNVTIQYDGNSKIMHIFIFMSTETNSAAITTPIISTPLKLSDHLPKVVYAGFSASTSNLTQLNCVKSWNFTSDDESSSNLLWVWITLPTVILLFIIGSTICYLYCRRKLAEDQDPDIEQEINKGSTMAPRKFRLKELKTATGNFHAKNKLGEGGFGAVFKGILKENKLEVAVKRVSKDSNQGKQEFLAEVTTISRLRHKNLVKLIGWCYEKKELLLVYEFMPRGSLDKLIYSGETQAMTTKEDELTWEKRHKIIFGVASALDYLHDGCEKSVLHRDVKASNVMLDSEFNARLGDFGLARTIQQDGGTHHSTKEIAGTQGYMAPEYFLTSWATVKTDVYGFGVFILEVVCGQRPINQKGRKNCKDIVDWVWEFYGSERIVDAVDSRLEINFDKENMERMLMLGLACCHPNPNQRPTMRMALQVLTGELDPPIPPSEKPAFMWPAVMDVSCLSDFELYVTGGQITPSTDLSGR